MKLHHLLIFIAACAFASCKSSTSADVPPYKNGVTDSTTIKQLFPLAYGDYWQYEIDGYSTTGAKNYSDFETIEVTDTLNFRGHNAFFVDGGSGNQYLRYYSGSDLYETQLIDSTSYPSLRYPLSLGEDLTLNDTLISSSKVVISLKGFTVPVSVPAGNFTCVNIETSDISGGLSPVTTSVISSYYAPNVGLVKIENYQFNGAPGQRQLTSVQELLSYHVN